MNAEIMTKEQLKNTYETRLIHTFPENEVKPLSSMYGLMDKSCYDPIIFSDNGNSIGYALMAKVPDSDFMLLDYLEIFSEYRSLGYGGKILSFLKEIYPDKTIYIESENPVFYEDKEKCIRRLKFYENNGCRDTNVYSRIWDADYKNLYLSKRAPSLSENISAINRIYEMFISDPIIREKKVFIYAEEGELS